MTSKTSRETDCKTAYEWTHHLVRKGLAMTLFGSQITALYGGIAVLLIALSLLSACGGLGASAASVQKTQIAGTRSTRDVVVPESKIVLHGVFNRDSTDIRPGSEPVLDAAIDFLKNQPDMKVYVDAFCDPTGAKQSNLRLSQQRAVVVAVYLENHGIAPDRLIPRGFGATHLVARIDTAGGRTQNRRVELVPTNHPTFSQVLKSRVSTRSFG
jgi:outer membrane protein OmpA-like peptidoglycan-associated protein